ncbi:hypothetical protein ACFL5Z_11145 [Planctomycetota bacterium]
MMIAKFKSFMFRAALAGGLCVALAGFAAAEVVTISFQNGADGYTGTFDRTISERNEHNVDGSEVVNDFLDGYTTDSSPDEQRLIRFDDIIGSEPGQIPAGPTILCAELVVTTSLVGNAQTGGPYGVAGLLQPFDSTTSYFIDFTSTTNLVSRGAWWQDGSATRPVGGYGRQHPGNTDSANVTSVVQSWMDGVENHGLVIQAGLPDLINEVANTTDGWSIRTTGYPLSDTRPKLKISYTTGPVAMNTFQDGAADHGIAIRANGTADGWQIHTNGSTTPDARPRLVVYSADLGQ